jgi:hypothetical protein
LNCINKLRGKKVIIEYLEVLIEFLPYLLFSMIF